MTIFETVLDHVPTDIESLVVVTHLVPGVDDFLKAINERIRIAAVIPKPNSIDPRILRKIEKTIPVLHYTREKIKRNPSVFLDAVSSHVGHFRFAIIDTGGYFSHVLTSISDISRFNLAGVVEDTENGHQKYEALLETGAMSEFPCPIVSVARSTLKDPEDFLVGQAIVFSADALLRERGDIPNRRRAVVLGYGKIGSSIAQSLRGKCQSIEVLDTNPIRQALALAHGFRSANRTNPTGAADIVFCATGNKSINENAIRSMTPGGYIFTATSGDDEIADYSKIIQDSIESGHHRIADCAVPGGVVHLVNHGNSANFMYGGVVGPFIKLVQAELVFGLSQMEPFARSSVKNVTDYSKSFIAEAWLENYAN